MRERQTRAVSQVVAIALLIGMVTVLSATIAVYAVSFGGAAQEPAPSVVLATAFDDRTTADGQYLNVTHDGGGTLDVSTLRLDVDGARTAAGSTATVEAGVIESQVGKEWKATETLSINRTAFGLTGGQHLVLENATVRFVYEREASASSSIIYECQVATPDCQNREN
jgi:FlaG/FlaF family flagellin (archaellin)